MYAGHLGVALAAKRVRPAVPLLALALASQVPDWLDATLCSSGLETLAFAGTWSHSPLAAVIAALVLWLVYAGATRDVAGGALIGAMVLAHLPADYLTGLKPTWPGGPIIGLALYRRPLWDFLLETVVVVAGWLAYRGSLPPVARRSRAVWMMLGTLLAFQLLADLRFATGQAPPKC